MTESARDRRGLIGLLLAEAVSLTGTRLSFIAVPWFVLTTTGSVRDTGLVAFAETAPYVVVKALGGPFIDRLGPRAISIGADVASMFCVAAVPLLAALDALHFGVLLALVALAGAVRGPGDAAKETLVPTVAEAAGTSLERASGLSGTVERLASTLGPALAGVVVSLLGPLSALLVDAATFAVAGLVIAVTVRRPRAVEPTGPPATGYLRELRAGFDFLRRDRLLRAITGMVGVTNLLDAALMSVLLPVWARDTGSGPAAIGLVTSALAATAIGGSAVATVLAQRLPRRATYLVGFLLGGAPRFVVLALGAPLWMVVAVHLVAGCGVGFLNPILSAVVFERIPRPLLGRVGALGDSLAWAGIPLGGPVAAALVVAIGLSPALLVCGGAYLLATTLPGLQSEWKEMDRSRRSAPQPATEPVGAP